MLATGWGATIDPESARERGISAILAKPYRRADLAAALERVPWLTPVAATADVPSARAS